MGRIARQYSASGIYHIVFRGINHQTLFESSEDYQQFLEIVASLKVEYNFALYAFCLMPNHVHLLLKENNRGDISLIMKRLLTKYVRRYNIKYQRSGALIAGRYKSIPVEIDEYFISVVRYIHQNPQKAGLVDTLTGYPYSSYAAYLNQEETLVDTAFVLDMLPVEQFAAFHQTLEPEHFVVTGKKRRDNEEIRREIIRAYQVEPKSIAALPRAERNLMLHQLKECFSIREIERVTGISRGIIAKS